MGDKTIKRKMDKFYIENEEQMRAINDPVHERIFAIMDDRGACTRNELCGITGFVEEEMDIYLGGLISIGFIEEVEKEDHKYYLPIARDFNVKKEFLSTPEGMEVFQEVLVHKFGKMAVQAAKMGEEIYDHGSISFFRYNLTEQEFKEARKKIYDVLLEVSRISEKSEGGTHIYQTAFFMFPEPKD